MHQRLQLHAEPSEALTALASFARAMRADRDVPWGGLGESVEASLLRIRATSRELARAGRKCSAGFTVHRASAVRRYRELADLVTCRGVIELPRHDQTALLHAVALLQVVGRLEGYVVQLRLDGTLISVDAAISAVHEVLAGAGPQEPSRGSAEQESTESREQRARSRRRRTAEGVQDAAAAMRFFLEFTGVETPTTRKEVTRAFRLGALKLHPDVRPDDADAQDEFCLFKMGYEEMIRATLDG